MTLEKRLPNDSPTLTVQSNQIEEKGSSQSYVGFYLWQTRPVFDPRLHSGRSSRRPHFPGGQMK